MNLLIVGDCLSYDKIYNFKMTICMPFYDQLRIIWLIFHVESKQGVKCAHAHMRTCSDTDWPAGTGAPSRPPGYQVEWLLPTYLLPIQGPPQPGAPTQTRHLKTYMYTVPAFVEVLRNSPLSLVNALRLLKKSGNSHSITLFWVRYRLWNQPHTPPSSSLKRQSRKICYLCYFS